MDKLTCFKAYDIRGKLGTELNEDIAFRIGQAYAMHLKPKTVVIGHDIRMSSETLSTALANGLTIMGVDVFDIGLCGTEEIYFSTFSQKYDGGIMVTASHNPIDYNGLKLVKSGSRPISGDDGLNEIKELAEKNTFTIAKSAGKYTKVDFKEDYLKHLMGYINKSNLKPLKLVVNAGNGCAGPIVDLLDKLLPFELIRVNCEPDGTFPNGIPNPLLPENRSATSKAVIKHKAAMGIAWDGDFDRCFLFDEKGEFIEGYYIVGLLAEAFLKKLRGAKIIHDPRLTWNTIDIAHKNGGIPVMSKTGHAFIKARMRTEDAVYGGEMSAHHYFKDFSYCDSGMIPWLLVAEMLSVSEESLSQMVAERIGMFPASGEINNRIEDPKGVMAKVKAHYEKSATNIDFTDGLSMEFEESIPKNESSNSSSNSGLNTSSEPSSNPKKVAWRFNLRVSNTEPVVRLNVETRGSQALMEERTAEILAMMKEG